MAANTRYNLYYLDEQYGISPADSEEEYSAAGILAQAYQDRGLETHVQEFTTPAQTDLYRGILMIVLFVAMVLSNVGSLILGIIAIIVGVVATVALVADRMGYDLLTKYGATAHSQNVVAVRRGTGDEDGRGVRPVVIVAHYDSPTESLFERLGITAYEPMIRRIASKLVIAVGICILLQLMVFLPDSFRRVIWVVGLAASLPLVLLGAANVYERRSSCTPGGNNNKSGVAALLSIMDKACGIAEPEMPAEPEEPEEPALIPVEQSMEQQPVVETATDEAPVAAVAPSPHDDIQVSEPVVESVSAPRPRSAAPAPATASEPEAVRHGASVVRSLGLLPEGCALVYAAPAESIDSSRTGVMPVIDASTPVEASTSPEPAQVVEPQESVEEAQASESVDEGYAEGYAEDEPVDDLYGMENLETIDGELPPLTPRRPREDDIVELGGAAGVGQKISGMFARVRTSFLNMTDNIRSRRVDEPVEVEPLNARPQVPEVPDIPDAPEVSEVPDVPSDPQETVANMPVIGPDGMPVIEPAGEDPAASQEGASAADLGATSPMQQLEQPPAEDTPESETWGQSSFTPEPAPAAAPSRTPNRDLLPGLVPSPVALDPEPINPGRRAALFDLPDPSADEIDPLDSSMPHEPIADRSDIFTLVPNVSDSAPEPTTSPDVTVIAPPAEGEGAIGTSAVAPVPATTERRGRRGLFGRKKKRGQDSMSSWLGVEDDYDAKSGGREIGSWDNFDSDDDDWKGGATSVSEDGQDASGEELVDAALSMGDEALAAHDIWFVSTGASYLDHAGMRAFVDQYRKELRGAFVINIDSVGAGELAILSVEGDARPRRADRRISRLLESAANDIHVGLVRSERNWDDTDATVAMRSSMRSATIMGVDAAGERAFGRSLQDTVDNVDPAQVESVVQLVCEAIRRS